MITDPTKTQRLEKEAGDVDAEDTVIDAAVDGDAETGKPAVAALFACI